MDNQIIFYIKALLLAEALTHAARSWVILDPIRKPIRSHFNFMDRLFSCFECSAVWSAAMAFSYLCLVDLWPITALIIISRWANVLHIAIDWLDALRASTTNKI